MAKSTSEPKWRPLAPPFHSYSCLCCWLFLALESEAGNDITQSWDVARGQLAQTSNSPSRWRFHAPGWEGVTSSWSPSTQINALTAKASFFDDCTIRRLKEIISGTAVKYIILFIQYNLCRIFKSFCFFPLKMKRTEQKTQSQLGWLQTHLVLSVIHTLYIQYV